ncbi:hypothetical protein VTK56DRAFT_8382 [Thermocarpiscus australiensis]
MASAGNSGAESAAESAAGPSSTANDMIATYHANNPFSDLRRMGSFDSDDQDDTEGGVLLSDFDSVFNNPATTPKDNLSGASFSDSDNGDLLSAPIDQEPTGGDRRSAIAPIGTGRFSGRPANANTPTEQDKVAGQTGNANFISTPVQHGAGVMPNIHGPMAGAQGMQSGNTGNRMMNAKQQPAFPTYNGAGRATQYPQSGNVTGHPYSTPQSDYNIPQGSYMAQQPGGFGAAKGPALGTGFPRVNPDMTPSHAPKRGVMNHYTTPGPASGSTPGSALIYNRTEPRNFAPRPAGTLQFVPPPPAPPFNLGRGATMKDPADSQSRAADSDPFLSPPSSGRTSDPATSQALVLASAPEENQLALVPPPVFYGPVPPEIRAVRSRQLNTLTDGPLGMPTQEVALHSENFPFIESCTQAKPVAYGVVKLKNIPFATNRAEIIAFLGRNSKILNDNQEPVHIIMERVTSKTQDAYVEFITLQDAMKAVERYQLNVQKGRLPRLGDRPVEVQLSSQSALMQDLFPLAAGVFWDGSRPIIREPEPGQPWKTFKGFVTEEEMTMLVKHVEIPQRSPYSKECPQRPYECMISTIKKLPWHMADRITVRQRYAVYNATVKLVNLLIQALQRSHRINEMTINEQLLRRLVNAAMSCPGFSVVQKDNIAFLVHMDDQRTYLFNQPRFADLWTHIYALCPKPGVPHDVLEWYIAVIREETTRFVDRQPLSLRAQILARASGSSLYFGYLWYEIGLPTGKELDKMTLREVAHLELAAMERALRRAFPPGY